MLHKSEQMANVKQQQHKSRYMDLAVKKHSGTKGSSENCQTNLERSESASHLISTWTTERAVLRFLFNFSLSSLVTQRHTQSQILNELKTKMKQQQLQLSSLILSFLVRLQFLGQPAHSFMCYTGDADVLRRKSCPVISDICFKKIPGRTQVFYSTFWSTISRFLSLNL